MPRINSVSRNCLSTAAFSSTGPCSTKISMYKSAWMYRSGYYADAYMPATQQFYLQDDFNVFAYPVVDAFFNFRIKRTRVLFRYNHANSYAMRQPGYFVTPYYTGLNSMLDLGINWSFFD